MSETSDRRSERKKAPEPAKKRSRACRSDAAMPKKDQSGSRKIVQALLLKAKKWLNMLRRAVFRLVRKTVLFLMKETGSAQFPVKGRKNRFSQKRIVIYAGSGLIVTIIVLVILFVPTKAAVQPTTPASLPGVTDGQVDSKLWQASMDNAIPTTEPDIAPIPTTEADITPTPTPKPTATPEPKATATPKPKSTATPKPTSKPKPTATPKPKPTSKPKPTATPKPKPTATPATDMDKLVSYFIVSDGPYYDEVGYSNNHYDYTDEELKILAIIIQREAGGESKDGKIAVGNVVINRVLNGRWGGSIDAVKGQFSYSPDTVPKQSAIDAAHYVLDDEIWKVPQNAYFFKASGGDWSGLTFWDQLGNHYFYTKNYGGSRDNGDSVPPALNNRTYKFAQYGCKTGSRVKRIQLMLKALDYEVGTDGVFGTTTKKALIKFQADVGLSADGVAGPKTVETLIKKYGVSKYIKDFAS